MASFYAQELTVSRPLSFVEHSPFGMLHPQMHITIKCVVLGEFFSGNYLYRNVATTERGYLLIERETIGRAGQYGWDGTPLLYDRIVTTNIPNTPENTDPVPTNSTCYVELGNSNNIYGVSKLDLFHVRISTDNISFHAYNPEQYLVFYAGSGAAVREIYRMQNIIPGSCFIVSSGPGHIFMSQHGSDKTPPIFRYPNWVSSQLSSLSFNPFDYI